MEETERGCIFVTRRRYPLDDHHGAQPLAPIRALDGECLAMLARREPLPPGVPRLLYLDTETTGLAGGTGTYAFLVGVGFVDGDAFEVRQYFMRDLDEEPALLAALDALLRGFEGLVTYNGTGFDLPLARDALRARPPALAERPLPPRSPPRRATPVERAAPRLPSRHRGAERARLPPAGRPARRAHPRRLLRVPPPQAAGRDPARVRAQPPRHPLARRADRLGRAGDRARAPARTWRRTSWPGWAPLGAAATRPRRGLLPGGPRARARRRRARPPARPARVGREAARALGGGAGPLGRAGREQRSFDPRPWEEMAKIDEHRLRDWARARSVVQEALARAVADRAAVEAREALGHRLERL